MTESKNSEHEPALAAKRKPDFTSRDHDHLQQTLPNKTPKLQTLDETVPPNQQNHALHNDSSFPEPVPQNEDTVIEFEEEEKEDDDDDYDDDDEEVNGSAPVDRKGKGIMIEEVNDSDDEDDDDDDDDSSDGGDESECESDLSDDPLAEVDLDNILPSRTRRHVAHPGVRIARVLLPPEYYLGRNCTSSCG